ncbi:flavin reductase (DIM6/NTAB) family NADH-FMN oxidoreductase RutF [Actinopolyspora lacussalsi]|nr:flavin reductase (DIM6/NTAB) family NADH-FMN oxidoreductase RutF [Actinopolyspora lacussalsi]
MSIHSTGPPSTSDVTAEVFRETMASVCAPVTIVTTMSGDKPYGATVSAFASLSTTPPMVLVALDRRSTLLMRLCSSRRFGVNVLGSKQADTAMRFTRQEIDRFAGLDWYVDQELPRIAHTAGWLACELAELVEGGDHLVAFGRVTTADSTPQSPLTYHRRSFGTHRTLGLSDRTGNPHSVGDGPP